MAILVLVKSIIGAGFAGLSAAYYLYKKNIEFIILEARNRIGGRVFSHTIDAQENLVIELGAEWVGNSHTRLLQHKVKRIKQDQKGGVEVFCESGGSFKADKIICTVPTFSAKNINWQPALPADQVDAMNELQYAPINKNPLLFKERFWKDESFDIVTDQTPHYFYHATKNQPSAKGVLISYAIGEKAAVVANQSDEWKADMIQQTVQPHFGDVKSLLEKQANYYWGNDEPGELMLLMAKVSGSD